MHYIKTLLVPLALYWAVTVKADSVQQPNQNQNYFSERVNLALRKTADRLLVISGDTVSAVDPVKYEISGAFSIRIENNLRYDSLPYILENALTIHGFDVDYMVSLTDCETEEVVLGYTRNDLKTTVPCLGREMENRCFVLSLIFPAPSPPHQPTPFYYYLALIGSFLMGLFLYQKSRIISTGERPPPGNTKAGIRFGHSIFDPTNQRVCVQGVEMSLTFREAKLLNYFLSHKNQLLERDQILSAVWEDEGIMVGRSLDVFVSRLRKLLKSDASVRIMNVHGVGYRFEVAGVHEP